MKNIAHMLTNKLILSNYFPEKANTIHTNEVMLQKIMRNDILPLVVGLILLFMCATGHAVTMTFTDSSAYQAALPGSSSIVNFDNVTAGTKIPDGTASQGIIFTSNVDNIIGRSGLIVADNFLTTSPLNFLGVDDGFSNEFLLGDELTLRFKNLIRSIGLFIIGAPGSVAGNDFLLTAGGSTVFNDGTPEETLFDGGEVFFLGLINDQGFSTAQLISFGDQSNPTLGFNIDDISTVAMPEPAIFSLFSLGLLMLGGIKQFIQTR
ncbi:hypothetical protein [Nitrosomonas sp.]|uniref:hypothetical protein n=1 Tax=Nitrosomonas sp. TaxID=42353 RepID=UPI00208D53B6|nr:hypothetical protein [Nitrosomonas sp.]GJL74087.1 MAG: hypothetical protein NMNS02_01930 [Nitrosomonas sp.]